MQVTFLGTGAAQGVPNPFSRNHFLEYVRKTKGKELRTKASLRLGRSTQIDFGPDSNWQHVQHGFDMYGVENLLITHSHSDHISYFDLFDVYSMASEVPEDCSDIPIRLYLSKPAYEWIYTKLLPVFKLDPMLDRIVAVPIDYYSEFNVGNMTVEAVKANHLANGIDEHAINYLFKNSSGKSLLYAVDTGIYSDQSYEYLSTRKADFVIMECTFGDSEKRGGVGDGH